MESLLDQGQKLLIQKSNGKVVKFVIQNFKKKYKNICLSIDTRKSELMVKSINHDVDLINDVSGFKFDKQSLTKLKKF